MSKVTKEIVIKALDELPESRLAEVLDFIGYLQWREKDLESQRISVPPLTNIVEKIPSTTEPPSIDEIVEIVHEVRRKRSADW
ncbi:MAG: hypothetical protein ACUVV0_10835 [Anaerolineae bacterium]